MNISESTQVYCKCIDPQVLPSFLMAKLYVSLEDLVKMRLFLQKLTYEYGMERIVYFYPMQKVFEIKLFFCIFLVK